MNTTDPDAVFNYSFTVTDDVIDGNGHVNNVAYVQWMQDVAVRHFRSKISRQQMQDFGCLWVARSHHIEYLSPALPGDEIRALTWIVNWRRVRSVRRYRFLRSRDDTVLAQGETDWVLVNAGSGRPCSIPQQIQDAFILHPE
ncbi:MAG: thioesterase family protein [Fuerstiella sp.]